VAGSVAARTGRLQWAVGTVNFHILKRGNPVDRELFDCTQGYANDTGGLDDAGTRALLGCYEKAANDWEGEVARLTQLAIQRLADSGAQGKATFLKEDQEWKRWQQTTLRQFVHQVE
jgi:hypothetical protein